MKILLIALISTFLMGPGAFAEGKKPESNTPQCLLPARAGENQLDKEVCVIGIAQNAKLGPVVVADQQVFYLKQEEWPAEVLNQRVRVTGVLRKIQLPVATQKDGVYSAGVSEPGTAYRLEKVKWKRATIQE